MVKNILLALMHIAISTLSFAQSQNEITIGKQKWLKGTLSTSIFNNGDSIPFAKSEQEWRIHGENKKPCFTYLKDKIGKIILPHTFIYNWYAINDSRGIAPKGYRIPTNSDLLELHNTCGGPCETARKLKSTFGWDKNDLVQAGETTENGADEFGLSIHPIPLILPSGQQNFCYLSSGFWTSTQSINGIEFKGFASDDMESEFKGHVAYCFNVSFLECKNYLNLFFMEGGLPVRCIKENNERNSINYPIPIYSNTKENFQLEKEKHMEALCQECDSVRSEIIKTKLGTILKQVNVSKLNKKEFTLYFDYSNISSNNEPAGIGISFLVKNGDLAIDKVVKGGACETSKVIFENDIILGIFENDSLVEFHNPSTAEVKKKLIGPENSNVKIRIKSSKSGKQSDVLLTRKRLPNWDLADLINKSQVQSAFPTIIDNYYFYYKYDLIPKNHKPLQESSYIYIISKSARLYYCGPDNYRIDDYFQYPQIDWNKDELISGAYQLATLYKGGTELNPIKLKTMKDAENLLLTFHYKKLSAEKTLIYQQVQKMKFEHLMDKTEMTLYFQFN
jgi:uncharacterized protein (TIGR02145 family)